jgi:hypothetical protein
MKFLSHKREWKRSNEATSPFVARDNFAVDDEGARAINVPTISETQRLLHYSYSMHELFVKNLFWLLAHP